VGGNAQRRVAAASLARVPSARHGDQGFQFEQNLSGVSLGVVIIAARDNRVETILGLADRVLEAVNLVRPGQVVRIAG